ncbi:MAG: ATP-dependent protease LonB, partial [Anaerotignum sp.]|nr:ATP-dependent protease LonB [Anaerotignum sp.]
IALTGEVSLHGEILPVGGVEEKLQAAEEAGVKSAFIPRENWKEAYCNHHIRVIPVGTIRNLLEGIFLPESLAEGMEYLEEKGIS